MACVHSERILKVRITVVHACNLKIVNNMLDKYVIFDAIKQQKTLGKGRGGGGRTKSPSIIDNAHVQIRVKIR